MMKIVVTGANGQLGQEIIQLGGAHTVIGLGRQELNIVDAAQCERVISQFRPDLIIHCAALTAVDYAESAPDEAYAVNAAGTRNLVTAAERVGAKFCYISTDYVFDGKGRKSYKESDETAPLGVYGKSKLAGESWVQALSTRYFIVRTSWLYGLRGNNFVKTMIRLAGERKAVSVVCDQAGSPTYAKDLAYFLMELTATDKYGIYHASNTGECSWFEFAQAIFKEYGLDVHVEPCTTEQYKRPAPRPNYSVMDHSAIRNNGFKDLRHWREGLRDFLAELKLSE